MARVFTVAVAAKLTDFFAFATDQGAVEDTPMTDDLVVLVHLLNGSVSAVVSVGLANVLRPLRAILLLFLNEQAAKAARDIDIMVVGGMTAPLFKKVLYEGMMMRWLLSSY
jgi:hypothetical protein